VAGREMRAQGAMFDPSAPSVETPAEREFRRTEIPYQAADHSIRL
jgi:hypothetical protein